MENSYKNNQNFHFQESQRCLRLIFPFWKIAPCARPGPKRRFWRLCHEFFHARQSDLWPLLDPFERRLEVSGLQKFQIHLVWAFEISNISQLLPMINFWSRLLCWNIWKFKSSFTKYWSLWINGCFDTFWVQIDALF